MSGIGRDSGIERCKLASSLASASARSLRMSSDNGSISLRHTFRMTITTHCLTYETLYPAAVPATVPDDHAHWNLNAGSTARPCVGIGHYVLRSGDMDNGLATNC